MHNPYLTRALQERYAKKTSARRKPAEKAAESAAKSDAQPASKEN